jgi:hypothetical protein
MIVQTLLSSLHGFELSNLTLLIGVIVASTQRRVTGINPGGLIAAAFLILAAEDSLYLALAILIMGYVIAKIYNRFLNHIYAGREPMFYMAVISVISMVIISALLRRFGLMGHDSANYLPGLIVPAILASAIVKQGVVQTYTHLLSGVVMSLALLLLVYQLGIAAGHNFYDLDHLIGRRQGLDVRAGVYMAIVSVLLGFAIYKFKRVKFAGYVILPFMATLLTTSILNFLLLMGLAVVAYVITHAVRRQTMVIGMGRYAFVLILSIVLVWTSEIILIGNTLHFSPFLGTTIFASLAIAVMVNDAHVYGLKRTVPALGIGLVTMTVILGLVSITSDGLANLHHHGVMTRTPTASISSSRVVSYNAPVIQSYRQADFIRTRLFIHGTPVALQRTTKSL